MDARPSPLIELGVRNGLINPSQADTVLREGAGGSKSIERMLIDKKILSEEKLLVLKGELYGLPSVDLSVQTIDADILHLIPEEAAENHRMVSFGKKDNILSIALVDPLNFRSIEAAEFLAKEEHCEVKFFVASERGFDIVLKKYRVLGTEVKEVIGEAQQQLEEREERIGTEKFEEVIRAAPISKMVSMILRHALDSGVSDVHIEPMVDATRVRFRVDGKMRTVLTLPKFVHSALVSRIKVLSSLKIDETRIPQDGRIKYAMEKRTVDFRVSILPLVDAEKVVMRVLDSTGGVLTFKELGFRPRFIGIMERNISKPFGMFLITGPTGSGKTTTLFAAMSTINAEDTSVVTLEDPVEYNMPGVAQSQINPDVGLTFAAGLRAILRQDPDVIMVGEIRDRETGELGIHAGLTGHVVFSTLHTNDALGAIPRLIDMGIQPFLLVAAVNIVIAQRLVRRICESCKEELVVPENIRNDMGHILRDIPKSVLKETFGVEEPPLTFYHGRGCKRCGQSGYKGRTTIAEFIEMTDELRKIIIEGSEPRRMAEEFRRQEMTTMQQDGLMKVLEGITTLEEALAVMTT